MPEDDIEMPDIMLVREIMSKPAITITHTSNARDAAMLMKDKRKGFLVVTKDEKPVGVLSDTDLINKIIVDKKDASKTTVADIMSGPFIVAAPSEDAMAAVEKMKKSNIHRLPVVEQGNITGVISLTDIARASPEMYHLLEYRQEMKKSPFEIKEEVVSGICDSCSNYSETLTQATDGRWACERCREELEDTGEF
jgi:CBS domain-containing protein